MVTEPLVQSNRLAADLALARSEWLSAARAGSATGEPLLPIVDAHHHFWELPANPHLWLTQEPRIPFRYGDYAAICKSFLPADYAAAIDATGSHRVLRHVLMEGEWDPRDPTGEATWVQALAIKSGRPHTPTAGRCLPDALAAQAWLDRDDLPAVLAAYQQLPVVRSLRHKPRAVLRAGHSSTYAAAGSMRCPRWRQGYALLAASGLMFELQTPWWHLGEAVELARDFPHTTIVLNHAGLPAERDAESLAAWGRAISRLAACDNVVAKLSGLGVRGAAWTPELQRPVVEMLLAHFGTQRCMVASNFPVDSLVVSLDALFSGFKQLTRRLSPQERLDLFCDTAVRVYGLT